MLKPFVFRALSPCHPVPMEQDYLLRVVEAARKYGYNAIQICADTHTDANLDGITEFRRFPKANLVQDQAGVRRRRDILQATCRAAHAFDMKVYFWHHELWFPPRLHEAYPHWFVDAPKNEFTRDLYVKKVPRVDRDSPFWEYMDAKFDEAFEQCPELDGTVMTIQESQVPIYCLFDDFEQQVAALIDQYRRLELAHKRVKKDWIVRTFAWREHEYRVVSEALRRWKPSVPVESKGVPMDWHLWYPHDPLLARFPDYTNHVEVAPSCEFYGAMRHPVGHPRYYTDNLRYAAEHGHVGGCLRIDRVGLSMLEGPDEGVLAAIGRWMQDPEGTDPDAVYQEWIQERYALSPEEAGRFFHEIMERCWQATLHGYYHDKIYIGDALSLGFDRMFFVAERHCAVEYDDPAPLREKDEAVIAAGEAIATLESLKARLAPADHADLADRLHALDLVTRFHRTLVAALVARQHQIYDPTPERLAEAIAVAGRFATLADEADRDFPAWEAGPGGSPAHTGQGHWHFASRSRSFGSALLTELGNLPVRSIAARFSPEALGSASSHGGESAWQPSLEPRSLPVQAMPGSRLLLVVFAATNMCELRPLTVTCGSWSHRFKVGQFAWFLAHDRFRRYECEIPASCLAGTGQCTVSLAASDRERSPWIREVRIETERQAARPEA
jgi:hypothetical protein